MNRAVWALSIGDSFSIFGDQVGWLALLWLVMISTHSSTEMGLVAFCYGVAGMIFGPLLGNLIDAWSGK
ncbi:MAG: hypothetical protein OWS74_07525 [Firmicutes bacterium]|nr:hypothetical protein [Bacillota bacterium]